MIDVRKLAALFHEGYSRGGFFTTRKQREAQALLAVYDYGWEQGFIRGREMREEEDD